jgi:UDP-sulfoquinovose synthase
MASKEGTMKILVFGGDGYCRWPTSLHLPDAGHEVVIADNFVRRSIDHELGAGSLTPISEVVRRHRPDAVIHFAEQRAPPYSMIGRSHAVYAQQ